MITIPTLALVIGASIILLAGGLLMSRISVLKATVESLRLSLRSVENELNETEKENTQFEHDLFSALQACKYFATDITKTLKSNVEKLKEKNPDYKRSILLHKNSSHINKTNRYCDYFGDELEDLIWLFNDFYFLSFVLNEAFEDQLPEDCPEDYEDNMQGEETEDVINWDEDTVDEIIQSAESPVEETNQLPESMPEPVKDYTPPSEPEPVTIETRHEPAPSYSGGGSSYDGGGSSYDGGGDSGGGSDE